MSLETSIYFGADNAKMSDDTLKWLVEVRVEQDLNKITKFALRFEQDLCEDGPSLDDRPEIVPNTMITIIAGAGNVAPVCLARGPITRVRSSSQLGGAGSWLEAHCETRQVEMDRAAVQSKWIGSHKGVVEGLLGTYQMTPDVANVEGEAGEEDDQLNQSGTDFAFLNKMASEHGVDFWLSYEADTATGANAVVTEHAHFKISPPVSDAAPFDLDAFTLSASAPGPVFRLNAVGNDCPTVNSFDADIDFERPTTAQAATQDTTSGEEAQTESQGEGGTGQPQEVSVDVGEVRRVITITAPGNPDELNRKQNAALRAASWFVEGTATTSVELLHHIVVPHDIIQVEGAGDQLSIPFQVKSVTHVINSAAHMMDIKLRSNTIGVAA